MSQGEGARWEPSPSLPGGVGSWAGGRREGDGEEEPSWWERLGGDGGMVGGGDRPDDREAEAVAVFVVGADGVEALERLEETVDLIGRDDRPGVGHGEHGLAVSRLGGDFDASAGDVVPDGVVDEVCHEAL